MGMFKKSAGADGVISGYKFEVKEWPSKEKGGDPYFKLSFAFDFMVDGATEPQQRFMDAGFFYPETASVSDDGLTLVAEGEDGIIQENSEFARFVASLVEKGFPESSLDQTGRNFEAIIGTRIKLVNWVDKEATEKFGKRVAKKGKNKGKSYDRTELRVETVHALPEEGGKKPAAAKKTAAKPAATATKGKAAAKTAAPDRDLEALETALVTILGDNDGKLPRSSVSSKVVGYALKNKLDTAARDALRKDLSDESVLAQLVERGNITYDASDKKQIIALA